VNRRGGGSRTVVVDENRERDALVAYEGAGVFDVTGSDRHQIGAEGADLVVVAAQLRSVLAAVQSTEVPEEDDHAWLCRPEVGYVHEGSVGGDQVERAECGGVHGGAVYELTGSAGGAIRLCTGTPSRRIFS
jgi:hypothetical protein